MAQQGALPCHVRLPRSGASGAFVGGKGIARNGVRAVQSPVSVIVRVADDSPTDPFVLEF